MVLPRSFKSCSSSRREKGQPRRWISTGRLLMLTLSLWISVASLPVLCAAEEAALESEGTIIEDLLSPGNDTNPLGEDISSIQSSSEQDVNSTSTQNVAALNEDHLGEQGHEEEEEEEMEPGFAVLFPPFSLTVGVVVFYVLTRYIRALPYTAVMFLLGTLMGIATQILGDDRDFHLANTVRAWVSIDSELLLLVFLPGLIFKDSFSQVVHLFSLSLPQLLIFAFPMVLAGAVLGALVGYYIFPFGWSFNLAMTVGSILAATDPVAVAALLEEVGAPPRLKVHVAGESLLNDGSAIVFFAIFGERYFSELNVPGLGEDIDLRKGIAVFCQKALGGAAAGLFFGCGLLVLLFLLNHRFSREENVVQVTTVLAVAYLNYYVSDFVWKTSGVIATVTAGITVKLLGRAMINDLKLLEDFLTIIEHILNTILFTLGGLVWGDVIAEGEKGGAWTAREWGFLILLYVLLHVIRCLQFVVAYPLTSRIGLKTNWSETAFQIYGGLRGAVGIALAIALDNKVSLHTGTEEDGVENINQVHSKQAFAMVGGVAFLTLVINGITAGPFLRKLGLSDSTEARQRIVQSYKVRHRSSMIKEMVRLLCQNRFRNTSWPLIRYHVPVLRDLTKSQLLQAVAENKMTTRPEDYQAPHITHILPHLIDDSNGPHQESIKEIEDQMLHDLEYNERNTRIAKRAKSRKNRRRSGYAASNLRYMLNDDYLSTQEHRLLYISILKAVYDTQIEHGELNDAHVLAITITQSLDLALDEVSNGGELNDWKHLYDLHQPLMKTAAKVKSLCAYKLLTKAASSKRGHLGLSAEYQSMCIERSLGFMAAHKNADDIFASELQNADGSLAEYAKLVLQESATQYEQAENALKEFDEQVVKLAISHKFCTILLTSGVHYGEKLVSSGMLKESEVEPLVEEIEELLDHVTSCRMDLHPGEELETAKHDDFLASLRDSRIVDEEGAAL